MNAVGATWYKPDLGPPSMPALSRGSMPILPALKNIAPLLLLAAYHATAHEHHDDNIPEGGVISSDPIVSRELMDQIKVAKLFRRTPHYGYTY